MRPERYLFSDELNERHVTMRDLNLFKPKFNPSAVSPERAGFAAAAAEDAFGTRYPHPDAATFRDRTPNAQVPEVDSRHFKRGRHKRMPSWRVSG